MVPANFLFFSILVVGVVLVASSPSLFISWLGLELNTLMFIPLALGSKSKSENEAALKYFLTQTLASAVFLFSSLLSFMDIYFSWGTILLSVALFVKLGVAPFHAWVPAVSKSISWFSLSILLTLQKLPPLMILVFSGYNQLLIWSGVLLSLLVGAVMGLSQVHTPQMLAYSSIHNMGWFLSSLSLGSYYLWVYFVLYLVTLLPVIFLLSELNVGFVNSLSSVGTPMMLSLVLAIGFMSLGGLPPFIGFLPKWLILQLMMTQGFMLISFAMILSSLLTLFYYLRVSFSAYLLAKNYWKTSNSVSTRLSVLSQTMFFLSLMGLPLAGILF
uniref:NADH-ubiquinone oxidoreductase chain 2 n=1 Tax=Polyphemus pediculus TaxID=77662 RepID=A0A7L7S595_9CRUS|nr:NADH dehydrogenase subunit 2 [Polyphemus pediculus]